MTDDGAWSSWVGRCTGCGAGGAAACDRWATQLVLILGGIGGCWAFFFFGIGPRMGGRDGARRCQSFIAYFCILILHVPWIRRQPTSLRCILLSSSTKVADMSKSRRGWEADIGAH